MKPNGSQIIFNKVFSQTEKEKVFQALWKNRGEIICKNKSESMDTYTIKCTELSGNLVVCNYQDVLTPMNHQMIFMFHVDKDKYLFESKLVLKGDQCTFNTDIVLYKLQRRTFYRMDLPDSYKAVFRIKAINNDPEKIYTEINDLSAGGMKVRANIKFTLLHKDDTVKGDIEIPGKEPFELEAYIRHIMKKNYKNEEYTFLGLEFADKSPQNQHRMTALVMEIYRIVFQKET